jgi:hypothetical protein
MNNADGIIHELMFKFYKELDDNKYKTSKRDADSLVAYACETDNHSYEGRCEGCKYLMSRCLLSQIRDLASLISDISEQPSLYVIVAKSLRIYGPASKEDCESVANTLENVDIKKCDPHEIVTMT